MTSFNFDDYDNNGEDYCPLCIEEMDLLDKRFFPCPCGYQICQFCYNNIRENPDLNGRCPACRRKYDDESVTYVELTPEEIKADHQRRANRERSRKHREKERKEQESASRRHLAGVRVIQKNLVYIVGLNPTVPPEELQSLLRSDKFFGQFGKIMKVVVNKRNQNANSVGNSGYGIYITFARKEDAERCIREVDGSIMDGKVIRAAYGTTKYCSLYLKGLACPNPNCMFLHEPGEEADSHRQDSHNSQHDRNGHEGGIIRYTMHSTNHNSTPNNTHYSKEPEQLKPALPATASWAKQTPEPPKPRPQSLSNALAFPSLSEMALSRNSSTQNLTKKKERKEKHREVVEEETPPTHYAQQLLETLRQPVSYSFDTEKFESRFGQSPDLFPPFFGNVGDDWTKVFQKLDAECFLTGFRLFGEVQGPPPGLSESKETLSGSREILSHLLAGKR